MIGKLKRSLKDKCPECGRVLQLRVYDKDEIERGIPITIPTEYIACSNRACYYEQEIEQKRRRRKVVEEIAE